MTTRLLFALLGFLTISTFALAAQATEKLRLLIPEPHGHTFRAVYIGIEKGWFAAQGIEIEFLPIPGGAVNLVPQLASGAGDLAWAGGYTVIQARARGIPVVGINAASAESVWSLIVRKASNIRGPVDLKGKTIGVVAFSSATHFIALAMAQTAKYTEADVNFRPIGFSGPALISQGQIDGYIWFKNQGLGLQAKGASVDVLEADSFVALPQDLMLVTESTVAGRRTVLMAYLASLKRAAEYDLDPAHHAEGDAYQAKYAPETVDDKQYLAVLRQETAARDQRDRAKSWRWGEILPERLRVAQDFLYDIKVISKKTPVEKMYDNSLLPK